jgi:hypothetical protein
MTFDLNTLIKSDYSVVLVTDDAGEQVAVDIRNLKMEDAALLISQSGGKLTRVLKGAPRVVQNPRGPRSEKVAKTKAA